MPARAAALHHGRLPPEIATTRDEALADEGRALELFDMRRVQGEARDDDAVADRRADDRRRMRYLRDDLGYRTDLAYLGIEAGYDPVGGPTYRAPGGRWSYDTGTVTPEVVAAAQAGEGPPGAEPWLLRAMEQNPDLQVLVGAGLFDALNSCSGNEEHKRRLAPEAAANFTLKCYVGGHGFHRDYDGRSDFTRDVRAFSDRVMRSR